MIGNLFDEIELEAGFLKENHEIISIYFLDILENVFFLFLFFTQFRSQNSFVGDAQNFVK